MYQLHCGALGSVVAALLVGRSRDRFPVVSLDFSVTDSFRTYQSLVKMSTRNIFWG